MAGPRGLPLAQPQLVNVVVAYLGGLLKEARLLGDLALEVPEVVVAGRRQFDLLTVFIVREKNIKGTGTGTRYKYCCSLNVYYRY